MASVDQNKFSTIVCESFDSAQNNPGELLSAVNSVLLQSEVDVEILLPYAVRGAFDDARIKYVDSTAGQHTYVQKALMSASGGIVNLMLPNYFFRGQVLKSIAATFHRYPGLTVIGTAVDFTGFEQESPANSYGLGPLVSTEPTVGTEALRACLNPPLNRIGVPPSVFIRRDRLDSISFQPDLRSQAYLDLIFQGLCLGNFYCLNEELVQCSGPNNYLSMFNDITCRALDQLNLLKKYRGFLNETDSPSWLLHSLATQTASESCNLGALLAFETDLEALSNLSRACLQTIAYAPYSIRQTYERHLDNVALNQQKIDVQRSFDEYHKNSQLEIERLNIELAKLKSSTSWKLTAPIRLVKSVIAGRAN